jgi:hypothetical protein
MAVAKTAATAPEPDVGAKRKIPDRFDKNSKNSGGGSDDGSDDGSGGESGGGSDDGIGDGSGGGSGVRSGGGCGGGAGAEIEQKVSPRAREEERRR